MKENDTKTNWKSPKPKKYCNKVLIFIRYICIHRNQYRFYVLQIVRPISAFLIVDVQNDFISGTLNISNCSAQQNGLDVIEPINHLLDTVHFDAVFYSLDWHPSNHVSFIENIGEREIHPSSQIGADAAQIYDTVVFAGNPPQKQRLWPRHCVQDTWGSELHKDLKVSRRSEARSLFNCSSPVLRRLKRGRRRGAAQKLRQCPKHAFPL